MANTPSASITRRSKWRWWTWCSRTAGAAFGSMFASLIRTARMMPESMAGGDGPDRVKWCTAATPRGHSPGSSAHALPRESRCRHARRRGDPRPAFRDDPMVVMATEHVIDVQHWNDNLFSFRTTRDPSFRFDSGQFVMIGMELDGRPLMRAYSIASASWEEHLEFFSIKVPNGPLTSRLQHLKPGDPLMVTRKPTGTLVLTDLKPGKHLYLLGTGTGLAPFMSIIRDPDTYERYEKIVLAHGVRRVD